MSNDYFENSGLIKYVDCPCVEVAKQFNMAISCGKCLNSKKFAVKVDPYTDDIIVSICKKCNGCGRSTQNYYDNDCPDCNGKGYIDWIDKIIPSKASNY